MARTTRKEIESALAVVTEHIDLAQLVKRYGPGKLAIDYYNPGDNPYAYKIVWICDRHGGYWEPFGGTRRKAAEMLAFIYGLDYGTGR